MNISELFLTRINSIKNGSLSEADRLQVRKCLLDYIGVTAAGSRMLSEKAEVYLKLSDDSNGTIPVPGLNRKTSLLNSVFVHGMFSHVAELDDGERFAMMHPGAPLFSVLLPAHYQFDFSEERFEKAVLCGYEASILLARAMQPELKMRGYHGTGITGTIGAAVGLAVALNFGEKQLSDVLSAACTSSSGILKVIKGGSEMKPLNVAFAAQQAVSSVFLAMSGFSGSDDVLGGDKGFIKAFSGRDASEAMKTWDEIRKPAIHGVYVKPYASCRHCHAPVEAALKHHNQAGFSADQISKVVVKTHHLAIGGHDHTHIRGINSAKMSIPYCVASALITGSGFMDAFSDERIQDDSILALTEKVEVEESAEMTRRAPGERAAEVTLIFENGRDAKTISVIHPKGEPENPVSFSEMQVKTGGLLRYAGFKSNTVDLITESLSESIDYDSIKTFYTQDIQQ